MKPYFGTLKECKELSLLSNKLPSLTLIPQLKFHEVKLILDKVYHMNIGNYFSLTTQEKVKISHFVKKSADSDFLFVTDFPVENESHRVELITNGETIFSY